MRKFITLAALFGLGVASAAAAETREDVQNRLDNATLVLHQIMAAPDNGIPQEVMEHAKCIAIVPHMIKGGLVFGAENGRGVATCREVLTYSRAKGLFAGLTLTGANLRRDDDSMNAYYGPDVSTHRVLRGDVATPRSADRFIAAVRGNV